MPTISMTPSLGSFSDRGMIDIIEIIKIDGTGATYLRSIANFKASGNGGAKVELFDKNGNLTFTKRPVPQSSAASLFLFPVADGSEGEIGAGFNVNPTTYGPGSKLRLSLRGHSPDSQLSGDTDSAVAPLGGRFYEASVVGNGTMVLDLPFEVVA